MSMRITTSNSVASWVVALAQPMLAGPTSSALRAARIATLVVGLAFGTAAANPPVRLWGEATGARIGRTDIYVGIYALSPDRAGGAYVSYQAGAESYLLRCGPLGTGVQGWPEGGVLLEANPAHGTGAHVPVVGDSSRVLQLSMGAFPGELCGFSFEASGQVSPGWPAGGKQIAFPNQPLDMARALSDGSGGWWIAWGDARNYDVSGFDLYLQHLTRTGDPAPGWPEGGIAVTELPRDQGTVLQHDLFWDGSDGVFVAWQNPRGSGSVDTGIYLQHFRGDGTIASGWPPGGRRIVETPPVTLLPPFVPQVFPHIGGGMVFFTSAAGGDHPLDRHYGTLAVDTSGAIVPPWTEGRRFFETAPDLQYDGRMASDGEAGVLAAWADYRNGVLEIYAQHILPTGDPSPGWAANGVLAVPGQTGAAYFPRLVGDGHGGLYVSFNWESSASPYVRVQHVGADGQPEPGWGAIGVRATEQTAELQDDTQICSDGAGGAIVVWRTYFGELFAQRFAGDLATAVELSLVSAEANADRVRLEWRAPAGGIASASLERRTASEAWARIAHVVPDGEQRFLHEDRAVTPGERYAYRLVHAGGLTGEAWVEVPRAAVFALAGARPNPARSSDLRVAFSLASAGPTELSLYDVSGRRVVSRPVGSLGAGSHVVRLSEGERLEPGLYWLRLAQGSEQRTARVVVAE